MFNKNCILLEGNGDIYDGRTVEAMNKIIKTRDPFLPEFSIQIKSGMRRVFQKDLLKQTLFFGMYMI